MHAQPPLPRGRTWTAADYARQDAAREALGLPAMVPERMPEREANA